MKRKTRGTADEAEELECVRAYDVAVASREAPIPYARVLKKVARGHKWISRSGKTKKAKSRRDAGSTS
jgi:hypothetical protein